MNVRTIPPAARLALVLLFATPLFSQRHGFEPRQRHVGCFARALRRLSINVHLLVRRRFTGHLC